MDSSYITFLKKNGVRSPRGNREYDYEGDDIPEGSVEVSLEEGCGKLPTPSPDGEGDAKRRDGGQKGFIHSPYRLIEENYNENVKIFDLTDRNTIVSYANKVALSVYESKRNEIENYLEKEAFKMYSKNHVFCYQYSTEYDIDLIQRFNNELLRWATKSFDTYIKQTLEYSNFIVIRNRKDHTKKRFMPITNRFSKSYQSNVRKRMKWVMYKYRNAQAVLLTLTIDPKKYGNDKYLMWFLIKEEEHRFLTDLKYYFKKRGLPFPKYISAIESQNGRIETNFIAKGNPHIHIVFLGCKRLLDWRKIRDLWGLGHIYINRTLKGEKIRYPINYITKYITKTFTETNMENCLTQSLCWMFHVRSFSTNRGLFCPLSCSDGNWEVLLFISIKKTINVINVLKEIDLMLFPVCSVDPPPSK